LNADQGWGDVQNSVQDLPVERHLSPADLETSNGHRRNDTDTTLTGDASTNLDHLVKDTESLIIKEENHDVDDRETTGAFVPWTGVV
jgi:hypothetical protein